MTNIVYNEDCMIGMTRYPDKYFDLAVVDPPYFDGQNNSGFYKGGNSKKLIDYKNIEIWNVPNIEYYYELCRVSKNQIIWGINYFSEFIHFVGSGRNIWYKDNPNSSFSECEIASNSMIKSVKSFKWLWDGFRQENMKAKQFKIHPTQKPIELYDWLLQNYAKDCKTILDSHVGSGSSRIAAHKAGLDFTGFELDKEYWEAQEKRYDLFKRQMVLEF